MTLRLRNTLSGELEPFEPRDASRVGVYSCGPTVYGPSHVGNFRSFLFADLLVRYLRWSGYTVTWVMNITDVDDRIIRDSLAAGVSMEQLTAGHTTALLEDLRRLRIGPPDVMPRATDHIPEMAALIRSLLDRGHAYRTEEGSIFFRIGSWPAYGRLARLDPGAQRVGERVETDDYGLDDVRDFALWKAPKPGEPVWATEIGDGRPGWHIECSAMSMRYLGPSFDVHTGGVDLIFPHHEDEIAQSEAATGQPFVSSWLHCAHLRMSGQKMARREGNIHRPNDLYEEGWTPRVLRFALSRVHYRAPLEYGDETLPDAAAGLERLSRLVRALAGYREDRADDPGLAVLLMETRDAFQSGLDDDLNIAAALGAVFDLARALNRRLDDRSLSTADASLALGLLRDLDRVLGVLDEDEEELPERVRDLLAQRRTARESRDWAASDRLRVELAEQGIVVEDTRDGQRWHRSELAPAAAGPSDA